MGFRLSLVEKTTGKIGSYGVGFLNVLTDEFYDDSTDDDPVDIPHTNYSVMRITKDIAAGSRIGLIAVNKTKSGITIARAVLILSIVPRIV